MKLSYIQTIKLALAIKETNNHIEQLAGILAIKDHGDKQAIIDGKLQPLVDFAQSLRDSDKQNT